MTEAKIDILAKDLLLQEKQNATLIRERDVARGELDRKITELKATQEQNFRLKTKVKELDSMVESASADVDRLSKTNEILSARVDKKDDLLDSCLELLQQKTALISKMLKREIDGPFK